MTTNPQPEPVDPLTRSALAARADAEGCARNIVEVEAKLRKSPGHYPPATLPLLREAMAKWEERAQEAEVRAGLRERVEPDTAANATCSNTSNDDAALEVLKNRAAASGDLREQKLASEFDSLRQQLAQRRNAPAEQETLSR